jgi:hypothetical protein
MRGVLNHEKVAVRVSLARHATCSPFHAIASLIAVCAMIGTAGCIGVTGKPVIATPTDPASPAISVTPSAVSFGNVDVGATASQSMLISNNGTADLTFSQVNTAGSEFSLADLSTSTTVHAGQNAMFTASFKPAAEGNSAGSISIVSNAVESPMTVNMTGVGDPASQGTPIISVSPSPINFGKVVIGTADSQILTISNMGTAHLTVYSIKTSGAGFSASGPSIPFSLTAGQNSNFTVAFGPESKGNESGSISIASNSPNSPILVNLSGTGISAVRQLSASSTSLSFGNVGLGNPATQIVTLTDTGNANVSISTVSISGAEFKESGGANVTLTPNQSTNISVTFNPNVTGNASGSISVASNAQNSPLTITLSGTGVQSAAPSVALNWQPSTSQVIGYFVYRKTSSQTQYSKLNSTADPSTTYTDAAVSNGLTYNYAVTSVDSSNIESAFSNQVTVTIP